MSSLVFCIIFLCLKYSLINFFWLKSLKGFLLPLGHSSSTPQISPFMMWSPPNIQELSIPAKHHNPCGTFHGDTLPTLRETGFCLTLKLQRTFDVTIACIPAHLSPPKCELLRISEFSLPPAVFQSEFIY